MLLFKEHEFVPIRPKTAALLHLFLLNRGVCLTKAAIAKHVWDGEEPADSVLFQTIFDVRRVLDATGRKDQYFSNVKGVGYFWNYDAVLVFEGSSECEADEEEPEPVEDLCYEDILSDFTVRLDDEEVFVLPGQQELSRRLMQVPKYATVGFLLLLPFLWLSTRSLRAHVPGQELFIHHIANQTGSDELNWVEHSLTEVVAGILENGSVRVELVPRELSIHDSRARSVPLMNDQIQRKHVITQLEWDETGFLLACRILGVNGSSTQMRFEDARLSVCFEKMVLGLQRHFGRGAEPVEIAGIPAQLIGLQAAYEQDYPRAIAAFVEALRLSPKFVWAKISLARAYLALGQVKQVESLLLDRDMALRQTRVFDRAQLSIRAQKAGLCGDYGQVVHFREQLVDLCTKGFQARELTLLAQSFLDLDQVSDAHETLMKCQALSKTSGEMPMVQLDIQMGLGKVHARNGEWQKAQSLFAEARQGYEGIQQKRGEMLALGAWLVSRIHTHPLEHETWRDELNVLLSYPRSQIPSLDTEQGDSLAELGDHLKRAGYPRLALQCYRTAYEYGQPGVVVSRRVDMSFRIAELYWQLDQLEEGLPYLETCIGWFQSSQHALIPAQVEPNEVARLQSVYKKGLSG